MILHSDSFSYFLLNYNHFDIMVNLSFLWLVAGSVLVLCLLPLANCSDNFGTAKCNNGTWSPDGKLIGSGLSCPLPLDGKESTKGKSIACAMKKGKVYDGKTVHQEKIATQLCAIFPQEKIANGCKDTVADCLKDGKDYFKDPKTDTEYKSWYPMYACLEKWAKSVCKKEVR